MMHDISTCSVKLLQFSPCAGLDRSLSIVCLRDGPSQHSIPSWYIFKQWPEPSAQIRFNHSFCGVFTWLRCAQPRRTAPNKFTGPSERASTTFRHTAFPKSQREPRILQTCARFLKGALLLFLVPGRMHSSQVLQDQCFGICSYRTPDCAKECCMFCKATVNLKITVSPKKSSCLKLQISMSVFDGLWYFAARLRLSEEASGQRYISTNLFWKKVARHSVKRVLHVQKKHFKVDTANSRSTQVCL